MDGGSILLVVIGLLHALNAQPTPNTCSYPAARRDIEWTKLEGTTWYQSLNDGDHVSENIACVVVNNFSAVQDGFKATLTKYFYGLPEVTTDRVRLHVIRDRPGFYHLDKNIEQDMMDDVYSSRGDLDEGAVFENREVMFKDDEFQITDYANYLIVVRCAESGRWYVRPHTASPTPTVETVLLISRALHQNGICTDLYKSSCDSVL